MVLSEPLIGPSHERGDMFIVVGEPSKGDASTAYDEITKHAQKREALREYYASGQAQGLLWADSEMSLVGLHRI